MNKNKVFSGLTLNWHFTKKCNMGCKYCFVPIGNELSRDERFTILEKIKGTFDRINFVGGEPTIHPDLIDLMEKAKEMEFKVTLVTNGYRMIKDPFYAEKILNIVDGIGISIDSMNDETNKRIGRCHCLQTLSKGEYVELCMRIKNHNLPLKINTVVSQANLDEDFSDFYSSVKPDRIKMFQVLVPNLPIKRDYSEFLITSEEYFAFVKRHQDKGFSIVAESNELMVGSYFMLNAAGCFENDDNGFESECLLNTDMTVEKALKEVGINMDKYLFRYA